MSGIKFNHLTEDQWVDILALYDEFEALDTQQQQAKILKSELSADAKKVLQQMLNSQDTYDWLEKPIDSLANALVGQSVDADMQNPVHMKGREFGVWKVTEELAQGGMGQVFLAERADGQFTKTAALKTIKAGSFSQSTKEKFLAEMRTLAQLEHPSIARLIDGGVSDEGVLYFVMELVDGMSIVDYAKTKQLSLEQRLELLIQLCQAVAYAHQNLIIHGDLKPDNVLVNQQGHIKLLDFGVAGPIQPWVNEQQKLVLPQFTLFYAAPEQLAGKSLSTASDVFGLTAILYELLCGLPPRDGRVDEKSQSDKSKHKIIPIKHRLTRANEQHQTHWKGITQYQVAKLLHGELGAVINKGLAEAVQDRYKSAVELESDLQAVLQHEPVLAYRKTKSYVLKKRLAKFKLPLTIAAIGMVAVFIFALVSLTQYREAKIAAKKANWTSDFLLNIFDQADPVKNQQNPITVNQLTAIASEQLLNDDSEYVPAVRLNALSLMGNILFKLGQAESAAKIHLKQIDLLQQQNDDLDRLAHVHFDLALDYQQLGLFELALKHFKLASEVIPLDEKVTHMGVTALHSVAIIYLDFNQFEEAELIINKLLLMKNEILKADKPFESMSNIYVALAGLAEANENYELGLAAIEKSKFYFNKSPYDPIFNAELLATESSIYSHLQRYELAVKSSQEALEIFKRHYGSNHPETLIMLANHASLLGQSGDYSSSIENYLEILKIIEMVQVPDFYFPIMNQNLAHQYRKADQCTTAIKYFKMAEGLWSGLETSRPLGKANTFSGMARCYLLLNELVLAENYFDQALLVIKEAYGEDHSLYTQNQLTRVSLLLAQNKIDELNQLMPKIYQSLLEQHGSDSTWVANAALKWAELYEKQADSKNTQIMANRALNIYEKSEPSSQFVNLIEQAKKLLAGK